MTYEEIMSELAAMKSHFQSGFSVIEQTTIEKLYKSILGKQIANLTCGDCYRDAYLEIYNYLRMTGKLPVRNYRLKSGEYLHEFGSSNYYFNPIEDEVAERFLKKDPSLIAIFREYPEDWTSRIEEKKGERTSGRRKSRK